MSQFNEVALEVHNLNHSMTMTTIKNGLRLCPFPFSLEKRSSIDFFEMLVRAEKYACTKEGYGTHASQIIPFA